MSPTAGRILTELQRALTAREPLEALRALQALRAALDAYERDQVLRAFERGHTFAAVARELGISRQAAHRRYRALTAPAPAFSPGVRRVLLLARQEAARGGADRIGIEHVVRVLEGRARPAPTLVGPAALDPRLRALLAGLDAPYDVETLRRALAGAAVPGAVPARA